MTKNILLITSTIKPSMNTFLLKIKDHKQRLEEYKTAFLFYCQLLKKNIFDHIIYCDNSGYSLDDLILIAEKEKVLTKVEFISYKSEIDPTNKGRFYLEINLLNYCLQKSKIINSEQNNLIWKVTGRYIIKNIDKIILKVKGIKKFDFCCNCRNYPQKWTDFFLVGFSSQAFNQIFAKNISLYKGKLDGEIILRNYLDSLKTKELKILNRLPVTPFILGTRGYDGSSYGIGKDYIKYIIRSIFNHLFPFIWI